MLICHCVSDLNFYLFNFFFGLCRYLSRRRPLGQTGQEGCCKGLVMSNIELCTSLCLHSSCLGPGGRHWARRVRFTRTRTCLGTCSWMRTDGMEDGGHVGMNDNGWYLMKD